MPRMDQGDAFDSLLQRWLAPTAQDLDHIPGSRLTFFAHCLYTLSAFKTL